MNTGWHIRVFHGLWLTALFLAGGLAVPACGQATASAAPAPAPAGVVSAQLEAGGRTVAITAPGLALFRSGFAATVMIDGVRRRLDSGNGAVVETKTRTAQPSVYGSATVTTSVIRFEAEQVELLFRLGTITAAPQVVFVQAGIRNFGERPVLLFDLVPLMMDESAPADAAAGSARFLQVAGKPEEWLLTGLNAKSSSLFVFGDMRNEAWIHEQGGFYRGDGAGFLFAPAGGPVSYLATRFTPLGDGRVGMMLVSPMDGVRINPGQVRWGQQAALFFEPPRTALVRWTEWVAKTHGARTAKGSVTGWSSVYSPERIARGTDVLGVVEQIGKSDGRLRPDVIQIGENFEAEPGTPVDIGSLYPEGFPFYARKIAASGRRAGLKLDFDLSQMNRDQCIVGVQRAVQDGFSYLKIGYHQPVAFRNTLVGGDKTSFEVFRENIQALRKAAGEDCYILFCEWYADRATVGVVDASRTGPVTTRSGVRDVMKHVLRSYQLNGRWFAVDNDCYYMATELKDVSPVVGGWPLARTWISMVGMSCGAAFTSDMWQQERFKPYWRNVEVLTPPAKEQTEVLDICTAQEWPRLIGQVKREWGDFTVALLWNPSDKEQAVTLTLEQAGLDPKKRYAVWSFWEKRYLGMTEGAWTTPFLAPGASQHLRFTELPKGTNRPVLIGSNLHIYCGAAEIRRVAALESGIQIELADAGARWGDLFIYSRARPELKGGGGCTVTEIAAAGENAWRVSLKDRRHGERQWIELGVPVPVTRQGWFWMLCGLLTASLLFGGWRYLVGVRLQRERALEQERIRIARDIHDEVGSTLTWIGQLAARRPDPAIEQATRGVIQSMDEIVWAVNPKNDTLDNMANYLVHYTEEFLLPTGIECELDVPLKLPVRPLSADMRHNLFMVVKEALNNAVKHGAPRLVRLGLAVEGDRLTVTVQDDGRGFTPAAAAAGADGLDNMRQRLAVIGGELQVQSAPGQGTTVTVRVRLG